MGRLFGTDGIRGLANRYPMSADVMMKVGQALGRVLQSHPEVCAKGSVGVGLKSVRSGAQVRRAKVVVGKDTRLANYMVENAMIAGLCSMGVDVSVIGPLPTPGVAFVTRSMRADAGVMISASHNPYHDTGVKIFTSDGHKLPTLIENEIEDWVFGEHQDSLPLNDLIGKAKRIDDAMGRYIVFLKSLFPKDIDLQGLRIVVDSANGAAYKVAPLVFEELGAEVIRLGGAPDGLNINEGCGALHPEAMADKVLQEKAHLGIALDGDGDRCILADENGEVVDGDQIIGLCALQMHRENKLSGASVVTTPMSNLGLELTLKKHGISMVRAPVGDRFVVEVMKREGFNLGGEQSGHVIFLDQSTTGDGIVAGLKVLEVMQRTRLALSALKSGIQLLPQLQRSIRVSRKEPLEDFASVQESIKRAELALKGRGRVFVRYSGTEPVARVMLEGEDPAELKFLTDDIVKHIQIELG